MTLNPKTQSRKAYRRRNTLIKKTTIFATGSLTNLWGIMIKPKVASNPHNEDFESLASDWKTVGSYLEFAVKKYKNVNTKSDL